MRIACVIAEAYPFVKIGGLADVGGSLPRALARRGHEVSLVLPSNPGMGPGRRMLAVPVRLGTDVELMSVAHHGNHGGVDVYSVGSPTYFGDGRAYGYQEDDVVDFTAFSKAVVEFLAFPGLTPDVIHCHDWHAALIPQLARRGPRATRLDRTGTVLTLHNILYQGPIHHDVRLMIGHDGDGTVLGRGIQFADCINTVSTRYLKEILTPEHGMGLDALLRSRRPDLYGILNGIDVEEFDPAVDPCLAANFDARSLDSRVLNKLRLQEISGLQRDERRPLFGMVARLVDQKGIGLVVQAIDTLVAKGVQVVVMGLGQRRHQIALEAAMARHAGSVSYHATGAEALSRLVYAGSDFFLVPSTFEPCGLSPLIAMRYGSIPIVRRTGGLMETVRDEGRSLSGTGFTFPGMSARSLVFAANRALAVYADAARWRSLQQRAMAEDFSWDGPSARYEALYELVVARRGTTLERQAAVR